MLVEQGAAHVLVDAEEAEEGEHVGAPVTGLLEVLQAQARAELR